VLIPPKIEIDNLVRRLILPAENDFIE